MTQETQLPKIDLTTFFLSISSAAFFGLGYDDMEADSKGEVNLELARQNIELLELMEEKTKGNRNPEEDQLLSHLLFELRMRFVEVKKQEENASSST